MKKVNERRIYYILWLWDWLHLVVGPLLAMLKRLYFVVRWFAWTICCYYWVWKNVFVGQTLQRCRVPCVLSFGRSNKYNLWPLTTIVLHKLTRINGCDLGSCRSRWSMKYKPFDALTSQNTNTHSSVHLKWCCYCCSYVGCRPLALGGWPVRSS